ncbi:hypothetical protein AB1Y20_020644 [Prymnesium parvum]|uniref:RING-type E3 ubiquitin transferase n=1 Tax=Prymnesium parvum TaxID=97485 RepID=A0AB34JZZ4_PRYPA|mmetsp:Transcript_32739/g.81505  ORF Transcript_32739/g.81505 Transcript_32739/m.81505 type:complete len:224 (+) Transcript_32739:43-714(+)|eukprot:CAMPEP_0182823672 /NCGR_PEP_ID=MMETSP0006_2-20121128/14877_1 /TAXON_ID=97485 /ORGANISM="Prymnesium parvum, Strain Texoma1" /LENGTH=223 /DNA_ID=CAMNT_0024950609 /DNA_START=23 /DNA_END=694 /DNA_ORIENTATION=+
MGGAHSAERSRAVAAASSAGPRGSQVGQDLRSPQIRCYHCQGIFTTAVARQPQLHHVRCPYCSTINGVPSQNMPIPTLNATMANMGDLSPATMQRQEQLLRRLQAREITPLELLLLREFVEHLQHNRTGASARDIDNHTAAWVVDDVSKLPEELRSCCVCLEDINAGAKVRTLPCLHTFHSECAEEWLKKKKVCPLCQFSIDGQEDESVGAGAPNNVTAGLTG